MILNYNSKLDINMKRESSYLSHFVFKVYKYRPTLKIRKYHGFSSFQMKFSGVEFTILISMWILVAVFVEKQ